ncbi:MAG: TAT-variant-translocated molybdopterin oxidoreductase [Planctomycetota bacterium]|nr:TAT-variant-translocated molybdopterin oxidoreductase [Planctomycetota bacterium]
MNPSEPTTRYWRSLNDLEQTSEFKEMMSKEFPEGAEEGITTTSRRRFLQLMGASVALASATSCRFEKENLLPQANRKASDVPGKPKSFATIYNEGGFATGLMLTSFDGHPTKVEGNPNHSASLGATTAIAQAATLGLYDPDRSREVASYTDGNETDASIEAFKAAVVAKIIAAKASGGAGLGFIAEATASPSELRMRKAMQASFPKSRWLTYSPVANNNEVAGCNLAFGVSARPYVSMANAKVIVALDDDFLSEGPSAVRLSKEVSAHRKPEGKWMSRIYSAESNFSITGGFADHRKPVRSSDIAGFVHSLNEALAGAHSDDKFIAAIVEDVKNFSGSVVFTCGAHQPAEVHAHVAAMNSKFAGDHVKYYPAAVVGDSMQATSEFIDAMNSGKISNLVMFGGNPVYDMPANFKFADALANVATTTHVSLYRDETSKKCNWHVAQSHSFEHWCDGASPDGLVAIGQPLINPIFNTTSHIELMSVMIGENASSKDIVQATQSFSDDDLHAGYIKGSASRAMAVGAPKSLPKLSSLSNDFELRFMPSFALGDGRHANMGWLQELPDPMTKLTWDNAALISFKTAEAKGIKHGSMIKLTTAAGTLDVAAYLMPGHADNAITLALGYGRTSAGHVAGLDDDEVNSVGFDSYKLRGSDEMNIAAVKVEVTSAMHLLATTQDHFAIDAIGRKGMEDRLPSLVREGTLDQYTANRDFAKKAPDFWDKDDSLFLERDELKTPAHRWGMAIDLSSCTGCGTCTIACQSENNIAVVGKTEVLRGREMAWIRMDRYFLGTAENPTAINQPVGCQHCELAPCESVCPVAATVHSSEGLNDMVYNRCIGTRYCSNNCPYKVRRFNFFNYNEDTELVGNEVMKMVNNPDVTVRSRGVMEKCSMCVQRIERVRIDSRNEDRDLHIEDGEIKMACEQACPSNAIVFGDIDDEDSRVSKAQANNRAYKLLAELNNKPRVSYLARVRNPSPLLVEAQSEEVVSHG